MAQAQYFVHFAAKHATASMALSRLDPAEARAELDGTMKAESRPKSVRQQPG